MHPEVPAALARTGLVVVACWVLNAPVLLAIRVLGTCVSLAVWCRPDGCPLVSRPPTLLPHASRSQVPASFVVVMVVLAEALNHLDATTGV